MDVSIAPAHGETMTEAIIAMQDKRKTQNGNRYRYDEIRVLVSK